MQIKSLLASIAMLFVLAACGGGGGGSGSSTAPTPTPTPTPVVKDATFTMTGGAIDASAGATIGFLVRIDCPRVSAGSTRCAKVVGPLALSAQVSSPLVHSVVYSQNGVAIDPSAFNVTDAGTIQVNATVALSVTAGQEAAFTLQVANSGHGTVEVVGTPTVIRVVQSAAKIANATPSMFSKSGYGEIGGFDLTCPADTAPLGCRLGGMTQLVGVSNVGTQIDTFVGQTLWWQYEVGRGQGRVVQGGEEFVMNSPLTIPAGATVRVSAKSVLAQGTFFITRLDLLRVKDGTTIPLIFPAAPEVCSTLLVRVVPLLDCKG